MASVAPGASGAGLRVLVCIKRVIDYAVKVRVKSDHSAVELNPSVKMAMNPFCEIATEEAVRLKESGVVSEIVAVSIGPPEASSVLKTALAMGVDRAIHYTTNLRVDTVFPHLLTASLLAHTAKEEKSDLIICGKQSIDDDAGVIGPMIAGTLNIAQAIAASKIVIKPDKKKIEVTREVDSGLQTLSLSLPAVITTDLRLNTPRFTTLPNIMKAKKKPFQSRSVEEVLADMKKSGEYSDQVLALESKSKVIKVEEPTSRKSGIKVESVDELLDKLHNEAKVI